MRALLIFLLAFSAAPALAQQAAPTAEIPLVAAAPAPQSTTAPSATEAVDPLADLIMQTGPQTTDEEEAPPAAQAVPHKPTILPIPSRDPDEINPNHAVPQGGYIPAAEAYDLRVKGSILAAQGLQGPLDGGWALVGADGTRLYDLQIVDPAGGYGAVEGAWRDTRRPGTVGSTGLLDVVDRANGDMVVRFSPHPGTTATATLRPRGDGTWSGSLNEGGADTPVTARRVPQAELPPGYVPTGRGPVIWPRPAAAAPRVVARDDDRPSRAPACSTRGKTGKALKAAKAKCAAAAKKSGKGSASAKGKKGGKGKTVASKGKGSAKGKAAGGRKKRR
ncbi:MAG: hypothetical protein J7521_21135 [Caulobacter sp.]|nr:hypothetical protein [Caulobacter sp.]